MKNIFFLLNKISSETEIKQSDSKKKTKNYGLIETVITEISLFCIIQIGFIFRNIWVESYLKKES